ncbi:MAG: polysaccharide pyruvyl transferase family protein [Candidatus Peregrinibacteria bacterium]
MDNLLVGNYGTGNLGDEALREYFLTQFADVQWRVIAAHPLGKELPRLPMGIRSFLGLRWLKTVFAIRSAENLVFGGGTLFTDIESVRACLLWGFHALIARVWRTPYHLAFQGIGPFRTRAGERITRSVVRHAASISVRDYDSLARVQSWLKNNKVVQTFDPVFALLLEEKPRVCSQNVLVIIPRENSSSAFLEKAVSVVSQQSWAEVLILSLKPDDRSEQGVIRKLRSLIGERGIVLPIRTLQDLRTAVSRGSFVLSQRYHGALAALALRVPFEVIPQSDKDKLSLLPSFVGRVQECLALVQKGQEALSQRLRS